MVRQKPLSQASITSPSLFSLWRARYASLIFMGLACTLMLVSTIQPKLVNVLHINVANISAPLFDVASRPFAHLANASGDLGRLANLQHENTRLTAENEMLRQWYVRALALNTEVQSLRDLTNLKLDNVQSFVTSRVIADPGNAYVKSLLLAVGTQDGVGERQAVMSDQGVVGRIISAQQNVSRVLLINDVNSRIPVLIEGAGQKAIMAGQNKDNPVLTHIAKDVHIQPGMRVLTSGHGGYFPIGLPVGTVVKDEATGDFMVKPFADFHNLIYVKIIQSPHDPNLLESHLR